MRSHIGERTKIIGSVAGKTLAQQIAGKTIEGTGLAESGLGIGDETRRTRRHTLGVSGEEEAVGAGKAE
mgnify:FL=1